MDSCEDRFPEMSYEVTFGEPEDSAGMAEIKRAAERFIAAAKDQRFTKGPALPLTSVSSSQPGATPAYSPQWTVVKGDTIVTNKEITCAGFVVPSGTHGVVVDIGLPSTPGALVVDFGTGGSPWVVSPGDVAQVIPQAQTAHRPAPVFKVRDMVAYGGPTVKHPHAADTLKRHDVVTVMDPMRPNGLTEVLVRGCFYHVEQKYLYVMGTLPLSDPTTPPGVMEVRAELVDRTPPAPVLRDASCEECWGTGLRKGWGAPCSRGCRA